MKMFDDRGETFNSNDNLIRLNMERSFSEVFLTRVVWIFDAALKHSVQWKVINLWAFLIANWLLTYPKGIFEDFLLRWNCGLRFTFVSSYELIWFFCFSFLCIIVAKCIRIIKQIELLMFWRLRENFESVVQSIFNSSFQGEIINHWILS